MSKFLKKYFIPNEANNLKPHFFRWENVVVVLSIVLFIELLFVLFVFFILPRTNYSAIILPSVVTNFTNKMRSTYNIPYLEKSSLLTRAAQMKADDMARREYFSHQGPGGESPWSWFDKAGYDYSYAGENLAINFIDSEDVVQAWMRSETHKQNILNNRFTEVGIGVTKGVFEGREAVFVVQFFGSPVSRAKAAVTSQSEKQPKPQTATTEKSQNLQDKVYAGIQNAIVNPKPISSYISSLKELLVTPHTMVTYVYAVLITMIALALSLMIFIKIKVQHPPLILNGAVMLLVIGSFIVLNQYLVMSQIKIF